MKGYQKQNNGDTKQHITVFGNSMFSSTDLGNTCLGVEYWNNFIVIKITPFINDNGNFSMDRKSGLTIHLSNKKALVLIKMLQSLDEMKEAGIKNYSIRSGKKAITLSTGEELNTSNPVLIINEFNPEGQLTSNISFELNSDMTTNSVMVNMDTDSGQYETLQKGFVDGLEVEMLISNLKQFIEASSKAHAYFNRATFEYNFRKDTENLYKIMDALNIDTGYNKSNGGGSFNSNKGSSNTSGASSSFVDNIDDL